MRREKGKRVSEAVGKTSANRPTNGRMSRRFSERSIDALPDAQVIGVAAALIANNFQCSMREQLAQQNTTKGPIHWRPSNYIHVRTLGTKHAPRIYTRSGCCIAAFCNDYCIEGETRQMEESTAAGFRNSAFKIQRLKRKRQTRIPESIPEQRAAAARARGATSLIRPNRRTAFECQGDVKAWCLRRRDPVRCRSSESPRIVPVFGAK